MADNSVFITGAASGAFAEALNGLPPWATENTALAIERHLRMQGKSLSDLVKQGSKGGRGGRGGAADLALQDKLTKLMNEQASQRKKDLAEDKQAAKEKKERAEKEELWGKKVETRQAALVLMLTSLVKFGDKVKETLVQNIKSYDALQEGGINLASGIGTASTGFESLQQITALTNVRYSELQATMLKFSTAINQFGVGKFAKTVGSVSKDLTKFGYSSKEAAELTGAYLDSQKGYTDIRNKSEKETAKEIVQFGERVTDISMATGQLRGKILENINAISKSTEALLLSGKTSIAQSQELQLFVGGFKNKELGDQLLGMMTDVVKPLNSTFMAMQKTGFGAFAQAEMNLVSTLQTSGKTADEMQQSMTEFYAANENSMMKQMQQNKLLEQSGNADAAAANKILALRLQQIRDYKKLTPEEKKNMEKSNAASKDLANAQERLAAQWQRSFTNLIPILDLLSGTLNIFSTVIETVVDFLGPTVTSFIGIIGVVLGAAAAWIKPFTMITSALRFIGTSMGGIAGRVVSMVSSTFGALTNLISKGAGVFRTAFSFLSGSIGSIAGFVGRFLGVLGAIYGAFEAGWFIGTKIYEIISQFDLVNSMFDAVFRGIDHLLQYIPGSIGSDAKARIDTAEKMDSLKGSTPKNTEISVPKNPAPSTIASPSAKPATPAAENSTTAVATSSASPAKENTSSQSEINSILAFQTGVLEQILEALSNSVSVNKDILRYTKNQA